MTKSQFAAEPSMEDILASIRKMISEERLGPRPISDQIARNALGETPAMALEPTLDIPGSGMDHAGPGADRSTPSYSSLSDALKAATPPAEQRRSLEEKIADMLEKGPAPVARPATPSETLAAFNRPSPASAPKPEPGSAGGASTQLAGGAAAPRESKRVDPGAVNPPPNDPKDRAPSPPKGGAAGAEQRAAEPQTIISMPPRQANASGATQAGAPLAGAGMNGARNSPVAPRSAPQPPPPASGLRDSGKTTERSGERAVDKGSDRLAGKVADRTGGERTGDQRSRADARPVTAKAPDTAKSPSAPETKAEQRPLAAHGPSEALLDAVVDLVHREPDSLSVFTSGSAFIHGVGAPQPESGTPGAPSGNLDQSAAQLLRPMLRQWLADNMPRIVEEALRSELMSSQSPDKDTNKK